MRSDQHNSDSFYLAPKTSAQALAVTIAGTKFQAKGSASISSRLVLQLLSSIRRLSTLVKRFQKLSDYLRHWNFSTQCLSFQPLPFSIVQANSQNFFPIHIARAGYMLRCYHNSILTDKFVSLHCCKQPGKGYAIHLKPERNIMNIPQMAPTWVALAAALDLLIAVKWWHHLDFIGFTAELNKLEPAITSTADQEVQP